MKVYRNAVIKVMRTAVLAGAGLGIVVAFLHGHGALLLVLAGVTVWLAAVLCVLVPPYRWKSIAYRYFWKPEEQGHTLFEFRKRDHTLHRSITFEA